uniref:Uncharacterized protein n=1 Tax=Timema cristinae TaxID=61476 RepID=A0A7R9CCG7_TIMCR|nr:unnamed protein product [Timema cristinae]
MCDKIYSSIDEIAALKLDIEHAYSEEIRCDPTKASKSQPELKLGTYTVTFTHTHTHTHTCMCVVARVCGYCSPGRQGGLDDVSLADDHTLGDCGARQQQPVVAARSKHVTLAVVWTANDREIEAKTSVGSLVDFPKGLIPLLPRKCERLESRYGYARKLVCMWFVLSMARGSEWARKIGGEGGSRILRGTGIKSDKCFGSTPWYKVLQRRTGSSGIKPLLGVISCDRIVSHYVTYTPYGPSSNKDEKERHKSQTLLHVIKQTPASFISRAVVRAVIIQITSDLERMVLRGSTADLLMMADDSNWDSKPNLPLISNPIYYGSDASSLDKGFSTGIPRATCGQPRLFDFFRSMKFLGKVIYCIKIDVLAEKRKVLTYTEKIHGSST